MISALFYSFLPDAALTPYPAYKIMQIQYIAGVS